MKVKTSELTGATLDWAVRYALNGQKPLDYVEARDNYSACWNKAGPLIEWEIGNLWKHNKLDPNEPDVWTAAAYHKAPDGTMLYYEDGPTPLIAAMRCFVSSKLGDEVDVPEELT